MTRDAGAVLAAAGAGKRFGAKKQFLTLAGKPILHHAMSAFAAVPDVCQIVVVTGRELLPEMEAIVARWREGRAPADGGVRVDVVAGGARRQDSVRSGLSALASGVRYVLVHDAARPLVRPEDVRRVLAAAREHGASVIGTPASDSVKRVREGMIVEELPRDEVWMVQTPQAARVEDLIRAYDAAGEREFTDEASALRAIGVRAALVEGPRENLKITRPGDESAAEALLRSGWGTRAGDSPPPGS